MNKTVESVPNFSEGRDKKILAVLEKTARESAVRLLDIHIDADHNRSVFTLAGAPDAMLDALLALTRDALRLIDLNAHTGEHPKMGAADVIPLVPIAGVSMEDCAKLAKQLAETVWAELGLPVYLYEQAATREQCRNLADIRRGGFEGLAAKMSDPKWRPDYGSRPHPTGGAAAIGARKPLIAFNINLDTPDINTAKAIARKVRGSSGGLPCCKALGMYLEKTGRAQVSMNLTDYEQTPVFRVFEAVREEAARHGTSIHSGELVGLIPADALFGCAEYYLKLAGFSKERHVLERAAGG